MMEILYIYIQTDRQTDMQSVIMFACTEKKKVRERERKRERERERERERKKKKDNV